MTLRKAKNNYNKRAPQQQATYKRVTWHSVLEEKEKQIMPLNLNLDLKRLT
jgi:hypothetical protein